VTGILKKGRCRVQCEFVDVGARIEVYAGEYGTTGGRSWGLLKLKASSSQSPLDLDDE